MDLAHASLAKIDISDSERFVYQQDLRIEMDRDRKRQAHNHTARIGLDGLIDEVADLGEVLDLADSLIHLFAGETQDGAVEVDILTAGELGIETRSELEQCRHTAIDRCAAGGGLEDACAHLQQSALARSIFPNNAKRLASLDFEGDIAQRPIVGMEAAAVQQRQLLETIAGRRVDRVALRNARKFDGRHGHYCDCRR